MKKLGFLLLAVCLAFAFPGCELFAPKAEKGEKTVTVIFDMTGYEGEIEVSQGVTGYAGRIKEFEITTSAERLENVLDELAEEKKLTYHGSKTSGQLFITVIDNVSPPAGKYFYIYSDDADNTSEMEINGRHEYGGKTFISTSYGITWQPVTNGCTYIFAIR